MGLVPERWDPELIERAVRDFWRARRLDSAAGSFGPDEGPAVHQFLGTTFSFDDPVVRLQREAAGAVRIRSLAQRKLRTRSTAEIASPAPSITTTGFEGGEPCTGVAFDWGGSSDRPDPEVGRSLESLASQHLLVRLALPLLTCTTCHLAPSPETIVYQEETAPVYLLRFSIADVSRPVSALVEVEEVWKLLGTTALACAPDESYAFVRFTRHGVSEEILLASRGVSQLSERFPGSSAEILEEKPGRQLAGTRYEHPLAYSYPSLGSVAPPSGTIQPDAGIESRGSGFAPVAPAHGARDQEVGRRLGLGTWAVLDSSGRIPAGRNGYAGLHHRDADAFALHELEDDGRVFARRAGHRGIPRCATCGSRLLWIPGVTWGIDPGQMPPELSDRLRRLTRDPNVGARPRAPWPVAATAQGGVFSLSECDSCERLGPAAEVGNCTCGGNRTRISRTLLPGFDQAVRAALRQRPYSPGEGAQLITHDRGALGAITHWVVALASLGELPGDLRVQRLPTVPPGLLRRGARAGIRSLDSWLWALLSRSRSPRAVDTLTQESTRNERLLSDLWEMCRALLVLVPAGGAPSEGLDFARPSDVGPLDRFLLARFERMRAEVARRGDSGRVADAARLLARFLEHELGPAYRYFFVPRLQLRGPSPEDRRSALRTLSYILPRLVAALAPFAPFTAEQLHRAFRGDRTSVFQETIPPIRQELLDSGLEASLTRWLHLARGVRQVQRRYRDQGEIAEALISPVTEAEGQELGKELEGLARALHISRLSVATSSTPFDRYDTVVRPVLEELQRAYGMQGPRIAHVLDRMDGNRVRDGLRSQTLRVAFGGQAMPITPSMVDVTETLAPGWVAEPIPQGMLFVRLSDPAGGAASVPRLPRLSLDGFRIAAAARRVVVKYGPASEPATVAVTATGDLLAELREKGPEVARALGIAELRIVDRRPKGMPGAEVGRSGRGARWAVWVPDRAPLPTARAAPYRFAAPRVHVSPRSAEELPPERDVLSSGSRERAESLLTTRGRLGVVLGAPLLGAAKMHGAWESGFRTYEEFAGARYEDLSVVPGFAPPVADLIVSRFGGTIPPKPAKRRIELVPPDVGVDEVPEPAERPEGQVGELAPPPRIATPPEAAGTAEVAADPASIAMPSLAAAALVTVSPAEVVGAETPAIRDVEPPPPTGGVELAVGATDLAWAKFMDATAAGHRGVCISREFPDRVRARVGPRAVTVLWLSNAGREGSVRPNDLVGVENVIQRAIETEGVTVVYLSGIEYVLMLHPKEALGTFFQGLDALARTRAVRIWVPVEPELTDGAKLAAVQASLASSG